MFKNYLIVAFRNLVKYKGYTLLNISGLAIGISCVLLIYAYVQDELAFDRHYPDNERIYRITSLNNETGETKTLASTPIRLADKIKNDLPTGTEITRFFRYSEITKPIMRVVGSDQRHSENGLFMCDANAFKVFAFKLKQGNPTTALQQPFSIVLSEKAVYKYFGNANPMGKTIELDGEQKFTVTGVLEKMPSNTHMKFTMLASINSIKKIIPWAYRYMVWDYPQVYTYFKAPVGYDPTSFVKTFNDAYIAKNIRKKYEGNRRLAIQPFQDIHLYSNLESEWTPNGNIIYIYILSVAGVLILLISCFNFINMTTARAVNRAKEVGVRKVIGALRKQLIAQFFVEALVLVLLSLVLAIVLFELLLPTFNQITQKDLGLLALLQWKNLLPFGGVLMLMVFFSGGYPALYLSSFNPIKVLKGVTSKGRRTAVLVRKGLVVFQFAISCVLIIGAWIVYNQIQFMQSKKLGFNKDQLITMRYDFSKKYNYEVLRQKWLQNSSVLGATKSSTVPPIMDGLFNLPIVSKGRAQKDSLEMATMIIDEDFVNTLKLDIVKGRDFSKKYRTDAASAVLLNESAVKRLGLKKPIGQKLELFHFAPRTNGRKPGVVVGVVKDFHFRSLHHQIEPTVFYMLPDTMGYKEYLTLKIKSKDITQTLATLGKDWNEFNPNRPFEYQFIDQKFAQLYGAEARFSQVFYYFTILATFIALLGLFGLAMFSIAQRAKEIGIRKILGASVFNLIRLLLTDFSKLIGLAFLMGIPIAYLLMRSWLQDYHYRISIGVDTFLFAGIFIFAVAWITVLYHALKAARVNPVRFLRDE
ncbi:MAG TPA: hypothetical protein DCS93_34950 [Microscillaceae bacterium]|nr:hypothetical protein [Microscillaceae bacterium]